MNQSLLHIFRNTPFGRETFLQSVYSCRQLQLPLDIYIPKDEKFLLYFDTDVLQVDLDKSYLFSPESAEDRAEEILSLTAPIKHRFIAPASYTATGLPDLSTRFSIMSCPRSMSDATSRIGLGHIGSKVRKILMVAHFPILIPGVVFKPWKSITALYGGSDNAAKALQLALRVHQRSQAPLQILSVGDRSALEKLLHTQGLIDQVSQHDWQVYPEASLEKHLYHIPHDALVTLGAYGHGPIKALLGSNMELVQSHLPNPLLIAGPQTKLINP